MKKQIKKEVSLDIKIENDVPVSGKVMADSKIYELVRKLEVGQSFKYPKTMSREVTSAKHSIARSQKRCFIIRTIDKYNQRVWRVADGTVLRTIRK